MVGKVNLKLGAKVKKFTKFPKWLDLAPTKVGIWSTVLELSLQKNMYPLVN
jgi:hypothetical protein